MMTELDTNFMRDPGMVRFYRLILGQTRPCYEM
jgi:hypothetical protein